MSRAFGTDFWMKAMGLISDSIRDDERAGEADGSIPFTPRRKIPAAKRTKYFLIALLKKRLAKRGPMSRLGKRNSDLIMINKTYKRAPVREDSGRLSRDCQSHSVVACNAAEECGNRGNLKINNVVQSLVELFGTPT